jgi:hypothetical protein
MAPVHRLAMELSDQRAAARDFYRYTQMDLKDRSLEHRITAKRFTAIAVIARAAISSRDIRRRGFP